MIYYLYISDAKLDMLYGQLPKSRLRRLARELTIDLKVLSIAVKADPSPENRYAKLRLVSEYLGRHERVTPLTQGHSPWIFDHLSLYTRYVGDSGIAYFGTSGEVSLCLLGSQKHIVGTVPEAGRAVLGTADLVDAILSADDRSSVLPERLLDVRTSVTIRMVEDIARFSSGPLRGMSFLARTLAHGLGRDGRPVVLASPLYVALA